jgi:hypothetical protein
MTSGKRRDFEQQPARCRTGSAMEGARRRIMEATLETQPEAQSECDRLVAMVHDEHAFAAGFEDLLPRQIAAINERFQNRVGRIKLLQNRAEEGGISEVRSMHDIVPLLFAHTAYKSYPESFLTEQKWDRLARWLDTVSTYRVPAIDAAEVTGLDDWLGKLEAREHFVSCSSGTTGKCAMMPGSPVDMAFAGQSLLEVIKWTGLNPNRDRQMISLGQVASTPRNRATGRPMAEAFALPGTTAIAPDVPPITIGGITEMVVLRKKIADGTAKPSELAYYDEQAAARADAVESAIEQSANALIANRHLPLHIMGLYGPLFQVSERVRARGFSGKDFLPNTAFISGGTKRAVLPPDYREFIRETLNLSDERTCYAYGMQEVNTTSPRCSHGRYHMAPWHMLLVLDETGERLIEPTMHGEVEGRAAFFDLSMDGRWGGVISGDKVRATWAPCACGNRSPSVDADIQRYADTASGDKIACAGTIDAYIRGVT